MREALAASVFLMIAGTIWYILLVIRNRTEPVLASWIILSTTMTLGWISYWHSPNHSWTGNIGNLTGVASTVAIFITVALAQLFRNGVNVRFTKFQKKCLVSAGGIMIVWWILRFAIGGESAAMTANVLTQLLMVIGFIPLIVRLWSVGKTTEPVFTWSTIFLACVVAFCISDGLGSLYAVRGALCAGLVAYMVGKIRIKGASA